MNNVSLIGRFAADPQLRKTANDKSVLNFRLAVDVPFQKDGVAWLDCVVWDKPADNIAQYFAKGKPIWITGHLQTREFETKDGQKAKAVEVNVHRWGFVPKDSTQAKSETQNQPENRIVNATVTDDELPF